MSTRTSSTFCHVTIVTPDLNRQTSQRFEWRSGSGELGTLIDVQVSLSVEQMPSTFNLTFAPHGIDGSESLADLIPEYSVAIIEMGRRGGRDGHDPTVMVGLTGRPQTSESYAGGAPQRQIKIPGRGIEAVLADARVWFAPYLEANPAASAELDRVAGAPFLESLTGRVMWANKIYGANIDPRRAALAILLYYLGSHESGVVNLLLPSPYRIRDLLLPGNFETRDLAAAIAAYTPGETPPGRLPSDWTLADSRMRLATASLKPYPGSVLDICRSVIDLEFHEFFARYTEGQARLVFRSNPFQSRDAATSGRTLFEAQPTLETIEIAMSDVLQRNLTHGVTPVYNAFFVVPGQSSIVQGQAFKAYVAPQFCGSKDDPAYIGRYGIRPLEHTTPYIVVSRDGSDDQKDLAGLTKQLSSKLKAWYSPHPRMLTGTLSVLGRAEFRPGHRLLEHASGDRTREFYLRGVSHRYDFRTGAFVSTLDVTRGWSLEGPHTTPIAL